MGKYRNDNGTGSIYYDETNDRWIAEAQWTDSNGDRQRRRFTGSKKNVVKSRLADFKKELAIKSGELPRGGVTFEKYAEVWLNDILKNKLKPSSYMRKEVTLRNQVFPLIGSICMSDMTNADVQMMVNTLKDEGLSYSTIKKAYEAVSGCYKEYRVKTTQYINPCEGVTLPTNIKYNTSNIGYFSKEQIELICSEATKKHSNGTPVYRLGNSIIVLLFTGMRIGELIALKWSDIDFNNNTITINKNAVVVRQENKNKKQQYTLINQDSTKSKSGMRIIPLSATAKEALLEIKKINEHSDYVMSSKNNRQIYPRNINRLFHSILKQTGVILDNDKTCGVHVLRHTFASMLFENGCSVKLVSELLGHADTKITENIYIHLIQKNKVKAIQDIDKYMK